jgi:hypothetical protein
MLERWTRTVPRLPTVGFTIVRNVCSFALERLCIGPPQAVTHFASGTAVPGEPGVVDNVEFPPEHEAANAATSSERKTGRMFDGLHMRECVPHTSAPLLNQAREQAAFFACQNYCIAHFTWRRDGRSIHPL